MNTAAKGRPSRRLKAAALIASALIATTGLAACGSDESSATGQSSSSSQSHEHAVTPAGMRSSSQVALYAAMHSLWSQHMEWTYAAIAAFAADSKGFAASADRLMQNQVDIGNAIKPYYGDAAGAQLTTLLKEHISDAVEVVTAAKAGDDAAFKKAAAKTYANADAIGDFLAKANPDNWKQADMRSMMKAHIDQTVVYASDQLTGKYAESIKAYGVAEKHMIEMGDMLSAGIIAAFPKKFAA